MTRADVLSAAELGDLLGVPADVLQRHGGVLAAEGLRRDGAGWIRRDAEQALARPGAARRLRLALAAADQRAGVTIDGGRVHLT